MTVGYAIFTILFLVSVESQQLAPAASTPCSKLGEEGFICSEGCTKLIHCIPNGTKSFAEQVVRTCPGQVGESLFLCDPSGRDCSADTCDDLEYMKDEPITCAEDGQFPHPWVCSLFYTCTGSPEPSISTCAIGVAYDGKTQACTGSSWDRSCLEGPLGPKVCKNLDEARAYPDDPSIYYVCVYNSKGYFLPQMRTCKDNYTFNNDQKRCTNSASPLGASIPLLLTALPAYLHLKKLRL